MDDVTGAAGESHDAAQMSTERVSARLNAMFIEVLAVNRVESDDDFFALGGHSITAGRVIGLVRREMGVRISLVEFFNEPTVHGLTRLVLTAASSDPVGTRVDGR